MSSTYRAMCLSHDPALEVAGIETQRREALESHLAGDPLRGHEHCDLIGTRTSGALIEIYCPPGPKTDQRQCWHPHVGSWLDVVWVRLLLVADRGTPLNPEVAAALAEAHRRHSCWPHERVNRLRVELGVDQPKDQP